MPILRLVFRSHKFLARYLPLQMMLGLLLWASIATTTPAIAASSSSAQLTLLRQPATEVTVSLGNADNELKFVPDRLEFEAGKLYKLRLTNPSPQKHYFTAKDFADAIWTQKVEAGNVEVKGTIRELELKPKAEAEWVFLPLKSGTYSFRCPIAGHTEAGMTGKAAIRATA